MAGAQDIAGYLLIFYHSAISAVDQQQYVVGLVALQGSPY